MTQPVIATYRLQLTKDFTLHDAVDILDYLEDLNISHLYLSPLMESTAGSTHGYDAIDFSKISDERGGMNGFHTLCQAIRSRQSPLRIILDIVPNHMAAHALNPYWRDALEKGEDSESWSFFDFRPGDDGKIHLPILGKERQAAINDGDIRIIAGEHPTLQYGDNIFPLNEQSRRAIADGQQDIAAVLDMQHYNLVFWKESGSSMTYRRFFDVTGLVGVRIEDEANYNKMHKFLKDLLQQCDLIDGVRIDHIDGLSNPQEYLHRLHQDINAIWVEKILGTDEKLPSYWPVQGTTGYEFISNLNRFFIDVKGDSIIKDWWKDITQSPWPDFQSCVLESKQKVLEMFFMPELNRLVELSSSYVPAKESRTFWSCMTLCLSVYRTYITSQPSEQDIRYIRQAATKAGQHFGKEFMDAAEKLLPIILKPSSDKERQIVHEWQQLTGPVMAKGLEDTAHYRFTHLCALNEVGCSADLKPATADEFFNWLDNNGNQYPHGMKATSTHDTKRAEDARHRLYTLSQYPEQWIAFCEGAMSMNSHHKDNNISLATEIFLYQAIIGTWPLNNEIDETYINRIKAYILKSIREAKLETNWLNPNDGYESAVDNFTNIILRDSRFVDHVGSFAAQVSWRGALNSLAVQALKIMSPAIADIYQGSEIWDFSLVDPDNRRLVDYTERRKLLKMCEAEPDRLVLLEKLTATWKNGAIKLWLTKALLQIKRDFFPNGCNIEPFSVSGESKNDILAFRVFDPDTSKNLIVMLAMLHSVGNPAQKAKLNIPSEYWGDTRLVLDDNKTYFDLISYRKFNLESALLSDLLNYFPMAILHCD